MFLKKVLKEASEKAAEQKDPVFFLVGHKGSGKTSFIGGMSIHAQEANVILSAEDDSSKAYLDAITKSLQEERSWPRATPGSSMISFNIQYGDRVATAQVTEYAGEMMGDSQNFAENEVKSVLEALRSASHILVVLDGEKDFPNHGADDTDQELRLRRRYEALFDFLGRSVLKKQEENGGNAEQARQFAILLTKCDSVEVWTRSDAKNFIRKKAKHVYEKIKMLNGGNAPECLPISLKDDKNNEKMALHPHGYGDFFNWLFGSLQSEWWRRPRNWGIAAALFVLVPFICYGSYLWNLNALSARLESPHTPVSEIAKMPPNKLRALRDDLDRRIDVELEEIRKNMESGPSPSLLKDMHYNVEVLLSLESTRRTELEQFKKDVSGRLENIYLKELEELVLMTERGDNAAKNIFTEKRHEYSPVLSESSRLIVETWAVRLDEYEKNRLRREISAIALDSKEGLRSKAELIEQYAKNYSPEEQREMQGAAAAARRLIERPSFNVTLHRAGTFAEPAEFRVIVELDGQPIEFDWSEKSREATWGNAKVVRWSLGQPVSVKVEVARWYLKNTVIREVRDDTPLSVRLLGGTVTSWNNAAEYAQYNDWLSDSSNFKVVFSIDGFEENDWALLHKYLYPGEYWK